MSLSLSSQVTSLKLSDYLDRFANSYNRNLEQLSSGNKNLNIYDDPVAVTTSKKNDVIMSGNKQAMSNIELGQNLLSISEDTQNSATSNLQRIRDLCIQASSETYSATDKDQILTEIRQRLSENDRVAESTKFNNIKLFDGSVKSLNIQKGATSNDYLDIGSAFTDLHASQIGGDIRIAADITGATWTTDNIHAYMAKIDTAIQDLTDNCTQCGTFTNRLTSASNMLTNINTNLTEKNSYLSDTDVAEASADLVRHQVLEQATASILSQANQIPGYAVQLLQAL